MTETQLLCHCGKEAIGFISDEGWLCLDCFNKKKKDLAQATSKIYGCSIDRK